MSAFPGNGSFPLEIPSGGVVAFRNDVEDVVPFAGIDIAMEHPVLCSKLGRVDGVFDPVVGRFELVDHGDPAQVAAAGWGMLHDFAGLPLG